MKSFCMRLFIFRPYNCTNGMKSRWKIRILERTILKIQKSHFIFRLKLKRRKSTQEKCIARWIYWMCKRLCIVSRWVNRFREKWLSCRGAAFHFYLYWTPEWMNITNGSLDEATYANLWPFHLSRKSSHSHAH